MAANQRLSLHDREDLPNCASLTVHEVVMLLSFCLNATSLSFHGDHYQQTSGTYSNGILCSYQTGYGRCGTIPLRFWKRFVDDTCTALPWSQCQELLEHLNSIEATI